MLVLLSDGGPDLLCALGPCLLLALLDSLHTQTPASSPRWTQQTLLRELPVPNLTLVLRIQHNFLLSEEGTSGAFDIHGTSTAWCKTLFTL